MLRSWFSYVTQLFDSLCNYLQDSTEPLEFQLTLVRNTSSTLLRRYRTLQMWGTKLSCGLHIPSHTATFHTLQNKGLTITYWKTWILNHTNVKRKNLAQISLPHSLATSHTTIQVHALHIKSKYCISVLSQCSKCTETNQAELVVSTVHQYYFCGTRRCTVWY